MAKIAEALVVEPLIAVALEQWPDGGDEPVARDEIRVQRTQPRAQHAATHEYAVLVQRATDKSEIGGVGPRAAVGTSGHPDREVGIGHSQSLALALELPRPAPHDPLALRAPCAARGG